MMRVRREISSLMLLIFVNILCSAEGWAGALFFVDFQSSHKKKETAEEEAEEEQHWYKAKQQKPTK